MSLIRDIGSDAYTRSWSIMLSMGINVRKRRLVTDRRIGRHKRETEMAETHHFGEGRFNICMRAHVPLLEGANSIHQGITAAVRRIVADT